MTVSLTRTYVAGSPNGDRFTLATLKAMRGLAIASSALPSILVLAQELHGATPYHTFTNINHWVGSHVKYVHDPAGGQVGEWLERADLTIRSGVGDCDDMAILIAALALIDGFQVRFVAVGKDRYEHVFAEMKVSFKSEGCEDCPERPMWLVSDPVPTPIGAWSGLNRRMTLEL